VTRATIALALLVAALLASYGVMALTAHSAPDGASRPGAAASLTSSGWTLEGVRVRVYEGEVPTIDARAQRIEVRPKRAGIFTIPALREARMERVDARIAGARGAQTRLRADRATLDPFRRGWLLEGNASVEKPGERVACRRLRWDPAAGVLCR
jgi:hypothetical protein